MRGRRGSFRVRVNGEVHDLSETFDLDKQKWHTIEIVVDRLMAGDSADISRVTDSVETALRMAGGTVLVDVVDGEEMLFSEHFACVHCNISFGEMEPRTFSFNNPHGACGTCTGLGYKLEVDPDLVIPDKSLSISEGSDTGVGENGRGRSVEHEPARVSEPGPTTFRSATPSRASRSSSSTRC